MEKLEKIRDEYLDMYYDHYKLSIRSDAYELMKRAYNQALEDVKQEATQPDSEFYDSFIDENLIQNLIDKLKIK